MSREALARRWRELGTPRRRGGVLVALLTAVAGALGPLAGPTYEQALFLGLLLPSVAAVVTSVELLGKAESGLASFSRAVANGVGLWLVALLVAVLHGVRTATCDPLGGVAQLVLGPGFGAVLGGLWGAATSELARPRRRPRLTATVLAFAGPVGTALFGVAWFYATPVVFFYDPFVGFFNGALYDTVIEEGGLATYRLASLATLFAVYVASLHLVRDGERLVWRGRGRPGFVLAGALALVGSLASVAYGPTLGHWHTAATIQTELGATTIAGRCEVHFDQRLDRDHVTRFARDCDAHIGLIEAWLGEPTGEPVVAYLFHDRSQKKTLMGAAGTSIAKPWRREIYLNDEPYPHPVVGHELVHVLAGDYGRGPFAVAGGLGGVLPNPGLVEGIAMAASPKDDELTAAQWSAAMRRLELLPRLEELLSLAFFARGSSAGYVTAGAFVDWLHEVYGADVVTAWYGGGELEALTGKPLSQLEADWWASLDEVTLDEQVMGVAEQRFDRPSVLFRRCPHVIDEALDDAAELQGAGDYTGAVAIYREILDLDPDNTTARFGVAGCHAGQGQLDEARAQLEAIAADERLTVATRDAAREELAELMLRDGRRSEAKADFSALAERAVRTSRRRTLQLLARYADDPLGGATLLALLIGRTPRGPSDVAALDHMGRWRAETDDGTPSYLMARQYFNDRYFTDALEHLDAALARGGLLPEVEAETYRLQLVAACAVGRLEDATQALEAYVAHPVVSPSRAAYHRSLLARCTASPMPQ